MTIACNLPSVTLSNVEVLLLFTVNTPYNIYGLPGFAEFFVIAQ